MSREVDLGPFNNALLFPIKEALNELHQASLYIMEGEPWRAESCIEAAELRLEAQLGEFARHYAKANPPPTREPF